MKATVNTYFNVTRIISLIFGILFSITIVGLIIGIPMIMASKKFKAASSMTDEELVQNRSSILGWGIFVAIVFAPTIFGLVILLALTFMVDNYINNIEQGATYKNDATFTEVVEEGATNAWNGVKNSFRKEKSNLDKQREELQKLDKMRDDGVINSKEYEALRKKILEID